MKATTKALMFTAFLASSACAGAAPLSGENPAASSGVVYRTVDADTFIVNLDDAEVYQRISRHAGNDADRQRYLDDRFSSIRVRLASVDAPESSHPDESRNTRAGKAAAAMVEALTQGKPVQVACYDWGNYGRTICNLAVSHEGNWADLGGWLIQQGISPYITHFGDNPFFHDQYKALEAKSQAWP